MATYIIVTCENCGKKFERLTSEVNRNKRKNQKIFCNKKCQSTLTKFNLKEYYGKGCPSSLIPKNRLDEFSLFRPFLKRIKNSGRKRRSCNLSLEDLRDIWLSQDGICPVTGIKLSLKYFSESGPAEPYSASIDRIDSSIGYTKENIRYIALIANYAKNNFTDSDVIDFCQKVVNFNNLPNSSSV